MCVEKNGVTSQSKEKVFNFTYQLSILNFTYLLLAFLLYVYIFYTQQFG